MNRNPVLLIHGIDDTGALFSVMEPFLRDAGLETRTIDLVPNNGDAGLERLAVQVDEFVRKSFPRRIDIVAFSMGGLIARYYLQRLGGVDRVERFVSIASPHNGTLTGFLRDNEGARQMRPGSAFLRDLSVDLAILERIRCTSIWDAARPDDRAGDELHPPGCEVHSRKRAVAPLDGS